MIPYVWRPDHRIGWGDRVCFVGHGQPWLVVGFDVNDLGQTILVLEREIRYFGGPGERRRTVVETTAHPSSVALIIRAYGR